MRSPVFTFLLAAHLAAAQDAGPILVADQTFKVTGADEYQFALAAGDRIDLRVEMLTGRQLKEIEFFQYPNYPILRDYAMDQVLERTFTAPKTDVYILRFKESGSGKKVCRFTLHRTPAGPETTRMDTRVTWDVKQQPQYQIARRKVAAGVKTELVSLGGQVTVSGSQMGLKNAVNAYQFTLPPHTVRWAYRIAVGQAAAEARKKDADKLAQMLKTTAVRAAPVQPETALAAFALGMAINMTTSSSGEDVEYALLDAANTTAFFNKGEYQSFIHQKGISVDVQRRSDPLEGIWFFALRSDNWVQAIDVHIDIEAVTETPRYVEELFLEPVGR
ncbi:MAG: hypothetical protein SFV52_09205 [Saprospiraceae bacterium]|nr:hypothetical protein [Saprospiraceae bacterium]